MTKINSSHTHFRHSNGNHNRYLQFEAKFRIFRNPEISKGKMCTISRWGGILNHLSIAYLLSNICAKNYWSQTTIVEIIIGGILFWDTVCICFCINILTFVTCQKFPLIITPEISTIHSFVTTAKRNSCHGFCATFDFCYHQLSRHETIWKTCEKHWQCFQRLLSCVRVKRLYRPSVRNFSYDFTSHLSQIGHFGDVLPSQSLGIVLKKLNLIQHVQTTQEQNSQSHRNIQNAKPHKMLNIKTTQKINNNSFMALCLELPGLAGTRRNIHPPSSWS